MPIAPFDPGSQRVEPSQSLPAFLDVCFNDDGGDGLGGLGLDDAIGLDDDDMSDILSSF
jgi:hypothetical protein